MPDLDDTVPFTTDDFLGDDDDDDNDDDDDMNHESSEEDVRGLVHLIWYQSAENGHGEKY